MKEEEYKLTDLDYLIGDHRLQMMKAALPYMNVAQQKTVSLFVKFHELRRTMDLFQDEESATLGICSAGEQRASPLDMLNAIKPYGNPHDQDLIDLMINFLYGFGISKACQETGQEGFSQPPAQEGPAHFPLDQLKNFIPPQQQSKLETMQMVMSAMQQLT